MADIGHRDAPQQQRRIRAVEDACFEFLDAGAAAGGHPGHRVSA
jgi:hypothetical protein